MENSVRFILASTLLMVCFGINEVTAKTKTCTQACHQLKAHTRSNINPDKSTFDSQHSRMFSVSDIERACSPNSISPENNSFRFRRFQEPSVNNRNIVLQLSLLDSLYTLEQSKSFHSDQYPDHVQPTCDYYIFALRRILI